MIGELDSHKLVREFIQSQKDITQLKAFVIKSRQENERLKSEIKYMRGQLNFIEDNQVGFNLRLDKLQSRISSLEKSKEEPCQFYYTHAEKPTAPAVEASSQENGATTSLHDTSQSCSGDAKDKLFGDTPSSNPKEESKTSSNDHLCSSNGNFKKGERE